jgi:hypothetical protein
VIKRKNKGLASDWAALEMNREAVAAGRGASRPTKAKPGASKSVRKTAKKAKRKGNPGYTQHGASEDLFGGASRAMPRKVSDEHRPRVKVRAGVVTFAEGSPYKGKVRKANPLPVLAAVGVLRGAVRRLKPNPARGRGAAIPTPLRKPLVLVLSKAESDQVKRGSVTAAMVRKALAAAKASGRKGWDHIEVQHPGGGHAFDLAP